MDRIDTRELESELDEFESRAQEDVDPLDEDEIARMRAILALKEDGISEWYDGATLIPEDDFEEYAQELAEETGAYPSGEVTWPLTCIDWAQAASELQHDYTSVEFDGDTYLVRS
jgi:hypothetical protein